MSRPRATGARRGLERQPMLQRSRPLARLTTGWGPSYPETTGYIVPTMLEQSTRRGDAVLRERARRML
jgi:hypothetical protein